MQAMSDESICIMVTIIPEKNESYRRLFTEFVVIMYNDILTKQEYQNSLFLWLKSHNKYYRNLIKRHFSAINWFTCESKNSLAFEVLGLNYLTQSDLNNIVLRKFNGDAKFIKFYNSLAGSYLNGA